MKEIKRFDMRGNTWPSDDGSIVSYKDHAAIVAAKDARIAALQEQVRALAADSSVLKNAIEQCKEFFKAWVLNRISPYNGAYLNALCAHATEETSATDAALREIRAQAIEDYSITVGAGKNGAIYAARIRAGEQP